MRLKMPLALLFVCLPMLAQLPQGIDLQALKQAAGAQGDVAGADAVPKRPTTLPVTGTTDPTARQQSEDEKLDAEIKAMKAREKGPRRFGDDLFKVRSQATAATEGGIAEDYVLGTGDRLNLNVFGSATFDLPVQVDGRGEIVIPKVGTAKVAGMTLGKAKAAVQSLVSRNFSRSSVDVQVIKLREVRVFVMGEVYKPGSYLVSSLSSLVNVLSLAGGPTAVGSYRDIRVMRGGHKVFSLDLYPLRAEGLGNPNVALQSGDTVFVPLAQNQVTLEGAFQRVVAQYDATAQGGDLQVLSTDPDKVLAERLQAEAKALDAQLAKPAETALLTLGERSALEDRLAMIKQQLAGIKDAQLKEDRADESTPKWLLAWERWGSLPLMQFEFRTGETVQEALRFAGGIAQEAGPGSLSLRRRAGNGVILGQDVSLAKAGQVGLQRGDVLSALVQRESVGSVVRVAGWARVPGTYARTEGLRVGDLLKREMLVLPDTYEARGELIHTAPNGISRYESFDVRKALGGDPVHNLVLEDRDRIELHRQGQFRLPRTVTVLGPVAKPGPQPFHEGMRASDLLFRAGIAQKQADRLVGELARSKEGKPSEILPLDLGRLLSSEQQSPVTLADDAVNPRILPDDQITVFEKPDYKVHRTVKVSGQVVRPGTYVLDQDHPTLSQLVKRAGGMTAEAMPKAGVLLRNAMAEVGPGAKSINEVMDRLNETKMMGDKMLGTGEGAKTPYFKAPIMHGIGMTKLNRLVVDFEAAVKGDKAQDPELLDGDEVVVPRVMDTAYVVGEASSPFGSYKILPGMTVGDILKMAGGTTRNADTSNIRLVKADGHIIDSWVKGKKVEPGDTVIVPQRFRRDTNWQDDLTALTPLALILNVFASTGHL